MIRSEYNISQYIHVYDKGWRISGFGSAFLHFNASDSAIPLNMCPKCPLYVIHFLCCIYFVLYVYCINVCVYVLTGLRTEQYDQIMKWWSSNPQSGIAQFLDTVAYCYVLLTHCPCYYITRSSYHTSSSSHLGVPRLRPSISTYHMISLSHLGVSHLRPSIPTSQPTLLPPSRSYCMAFFPNIILLWASCKILSRMVRSCFSVASWRHQASFLLKPPLYSFSLAYTSNSGHNTTHCVWAPE